ncbi:hypothetical protein KA183_18990 [bacterium]|nr:hypothetical protein [bacterium]
MTIRRFQIKGNIACFSELGRGTKFVITLPKAHVLPLLKDAKQVIVEEANAI